MHTLMIFQVSQMLDVGSNNPIVARLGYGLNDIVKMARIDETKKTNINTACFKIMKSLIEAEKQAKPLMDEIKEIEQKIVREGIKTQSNGKAIEIQGVIKLDNAKSFLMFSKEALRILADIMGIILDRSYEGAHFHKIRNDAAVFFGEDHVVTKLLCEDKHWIDEILDLRNEAEHPKSDKPFTRGFYISKKQNENFIVSFPRFYNDMDILNRLEVYSHNLLTFTEEIIAYSMTKFFLPQVALYEIPSEQRDLQNPIRFRIGLSQAAKTTFECSTKS